MKNNFNITFNFILTANNSFAENFNINAKDITIDKKNEITIFKDNVVIIDEKKKYN